MTDRIMNNDLSILFHAYLRYLRGYMILSLDRV